MNYSRLYRLYLLRYLLCDECFREKMNLFFEEKKSLNQYNHYLVVKGEQMKVLANYQDQLRLRLEVLRYTQDKYEMKKLILN